MTVVAVRTVQEQVVDNLRSLILEGDFAPGDKLQQEDLATLLGVSAMPVREGLRQLQAEGLVSFVPRRGAFVTYLDRDELEEILRMREELEVLALRWAVGRTGPADVAPLRELLERVESAEAEQDVERRSEAVRDFLWSAFEVSARPNLLQAIRRYYNMTYLYQRQYSALVDLAPRRVEVFDRMLQAIAAGDVEGAVDAHRETHCLVRDAMLRLADRAT